MHLISNFELFLLLYGSFHKDIETIDMEDVRHNGVNLTGFRLVDQDELATREILKQMDRYQRRSGARLLNSSYVIQVIFSSCQIQLFFLNMIFDLRFMFLLNFQRF